MSRVTIKNVKFYPSMSEETYCFTATVYFDRRKVGTARNDGHGGCTFVDFDSPQDRDAVQAYCATLPPKIYGDSAYPVHADDLIDGCFDEWIAEEEAKKLRKNCDKGICFGSPKSYQITSYTIGGKSATIAQILMTRNGLALLRAEVDRLKSVGQTVLNQNLPFPV